MFSKVKRTHLEGLNDLSDYLRVTSFTGKMSSSPIILICANKIFIWNKVQK